MDELHRLYQDQTMMALGIYSFLDNLLANMPNRQNSEESSLEPEFALTTASASVGDVTQTRPTLPITPEITSDFLSTLRERREREPILPQLSTWSVEELNELDSIEVEVPQNDLPNASDAGSELNSPTKPANLEPGGYSEDIFIYLSEREKEEYMCCVW